jgi:diguanylate cyclase (GGDEF)-like protein/PAS domain S-box-containing protein/putative nucleotidyltransferase with HDIG domain
MIGGRRVWQTPCGRASPSRHAEVPIERPQRWVGGALVVAAIVAATALAVLAGIRHERSQVEDERARLAEPAVRALAAEVEGAVAGLEDLRAFFESSDEVTAEDFRRFTLAPLGRQDSLAYLAWTPREGEGLVAGRGDPDAVAAALAAPEAAGALAAARDGAVPRLAAPAPPVADPVALIVAPVYEAGADLSTVAARRAALRGHLSAAARLDELGAPARTGLPEGVELVVRDGPEPVLGPDGPVEPDGVIEVGGREWTVGLAGLPGPSRALPLGLGLGGLALAVVVALLFRASSARERDARRELAGLRVRHDLILGAAGDGIVGLDPECRATFVNPAAARALGWDVDDLTGGRFDELVLPAIGAAVRGGRLLSGEGPVRRRDGSTFVGEYTTTPIAGSGSGAAGAVVVFRDITARKEEERRTRESLAAAEERAAVDALTGLANHRTFHDRLRVELERARRRGHGLALVLMDLDHFKQVNDRFGHQAGDRVLAHAARVFAEQTRAGELVARVGGEEFAMILPGADGDEAYRAAERVRRAIAAAAFPGVGRMTMSAGVCDLRDAGDAESLYALADGALYWAKHNGRDMVLRHSPDAPGPRPAARNGDGDGRGSLVSVRLLARVVDAKHPSTRRHSERVAALAAELAVELGWPPSRVSELREAALLHDVGKIGVPEELLTTPRALAPHELDRMRAHVEMGERILAETLSAEQLSWVRGHHERWDGDGYPDGLRAGDCPEGARILALAEAWDVMTSERPYAPVPLTHPDAIAECRALSGTQFWPPAVEALARIRGGA